ncbi:MAG: dephospho-CoA kinase [Victivallaceae bacterium]|jgi:dephospho-CoA kinase
MIAALTGSIGCGKSTVLEIFSRMEWFTLSADRICHDIYNSGDLEFNAAIAERWGADIIRDDGTADKKRISAIVFNDKKELNWLNSVLHPIIMEKAGQLISSVNREFVLFEVPLLYEAGLEDSFDAVICVWTSAASQHRRLKERGLDEKDIRLRMNNQLSADIKLEKAGYGLINEGRVELLNEQCVILNHQIREEYGRQR